AFGFRVASATLPSTVSAKRMRPFGNQRSQLGDVFRPGVRFSAPPPSAAELKISPPVAPSSLMIPSIHAIRFPSGDQRGLAICSAGLYTLRNSPVDAETAYNCATHQLLSPLPLAAV